MQKYGMLKDGSLIISDVQLEGYKPIQFAEVPEFDQALYYVKQGMVVENEDFISIGVEIVKVTLQEETGEPETVNEFVEPVPWKQTSEIESLRSQLETVQGALDFIIMNY
jgi:hypothetical protein